MQIMKTRSFIFIALTWLFLAGCFSCSDHRPEIISVACNNQISPLGVLARDLNFSWKIGSIERNRMQGAYQVIVYAGNRKDIVWDSGKTESDNSIRVEYGGRELKSGAVYYWKVRVWDQEGYVSRWSKTSRFVTALAGMNDWSGAKWIGYDELDSAKRIVPGIHAPWSLPGWKEKSSGEHVIPLLRKEFRLKPGIKHAIVFVSGVGQYELILNGRKVGDRFLAPGWTYYDTLCFYNVYDVSKQLRTGGNVLGMMLGNGFYNIPNKPYRKLLTAFGNPAMILKLEVVYHDGRKEEIISDKTWKTTPSPVTFSSIYAGETYNAMLEVSRWAKPGFSDNAWRNAVVVKSPCKRLEPEYDYPVKVMERIDVVSIVQTDTLGKRFLYDFGQNASGIIELRVKGNRGDTVRLIPAELVDERLRANQNATGRPYVLTYILKGKGVEKWSPRFTYYGFRYVEVEGAVPAGNHSVLGLPEIKKLTLLHTRNSAPETGSFITSDTLFSRINQLIRWAIRSNMQSVLTDCPHREKLGWLEQTYLMGNSIHFNYDNYHLYKKVINDMMVAQFGNGMVPTIAPEFTRFKGGFLDTPEWGSASVILPWLMYKWYGDTGPMKNAWTMMAKYVEYLKSKSENNILDYGLGDWFDLGPKPPGFAQLTPVKLTATAIYYYDVWLMSQMAAILGKTEENKKYGVLAEEIRKSFNEAFFDSENMTYSTGSQTAIAMPLVLGMTDPDKRSSVFQNLIKLVNRSGNALTAGDVGFHFLVRALSEGGAGELLAEMNSRNDVPGYGFQLKKGATSLTESWAALENVSNNHLMLGHLMEWFYNGLAGINQTPASVAFREIKIEPQMVNRINEAGASFESPYGTIRSHWKKKGEGYRLEVDIPFNTTALICIPVEEGKTLTENGRPIPGSWTIGKESRQMVVSIGSGRYLFESIHSSN